MRWATASGARALELAPLVIGVRRQAGEGPGGSGFVIETHMGQPVTQVRSSWIDELGHLYLDTEHGLGVVRSLDMDAAADAIEACGWQPEEVTVAELPGRFGFVLRPQQPA